MATAELKEEQKLRVEELRLIDVTDYDLAVCGWRPSPLSRMLHDAFTIQVREETNIQEALIEGRGIYALHQKENLCGEKIPGGHIHLLEKTEFSSGVKAMVTKDNPQSDHLPRVVIIEIEKPK